jgi:hypothetical protein
MLRRCFLASLLCAFALGTAAPPFLPGAGPAPPPTGSDSTHPGRMRVTDSASARAATSVGPIPAPAPFTKPAVQAAAYDSVRNAALDSLRPAGYTAPDSSRRGAPVDGTVRDSAAARDARTNYSWSAPADYDSCRSAQGALPCWRGARDLANQEIGFPGPRAWTLSLTHWRPLPQSSPYFLFWKDSPYLSGGLPPPDRYALHRTGGDLDGIDEAWTPVMPLDTPVTNLTWTRGALTLNQFDLRLNRMLSRRAYLGFEYYTSTADSATYDYQFNVHQPYLGGWGFLGKLYKPIDRDSASLVLAGTSHAIHALTVRPRLGFWLDSNRVLEAFLDQTRNSSSLTYPAGLPHPAATTLSSGPDSMQALMPSRFSTLTEGLLYGETHSDWTGQVEAAHGGADWSDTRGRGAEASKDALAGELYRLRALARADGLPGKPSLSVQALSEYWTGEPVLGGAGLGASGWGDAEEAEARLQPEFGPLRLEGSAGLGRGSRMADRVEWLPRFGGLAQVAMPLGFSAEASASTRAEDPAWEILYRTNPAHFRYANPGLGPRTDRTMRGALAWSWSRYFLEAGFDRYDGKDVWLARVLPGRDACGALADSAYQSLAGTTCADSTGPTGATGAGTSAQAAQPRLPDSLALALRNYSRETIDAWHLGLGLGLGNWSLDLRERFVLSRQVEDPELKGTFTDRSVPERVFQGRLAWKRSLVEDRLKVEFSWNWEWFSTRYAWAPDLSGASTLSKLDEYLVLDFEARMRIKTFLLYFDAMNLNHDRYATEPGVHPPGLNFRFGVDWTLWN